MNQKLRRIVQGLDVNDQAFEKTCFKFCYFCACRISQNLESAESIQAFHNFEKFINGDLSAEQFKDLQQSIFKIARSHQGSKSIDGTQHAAVSATYALANAINGNMIAAAEYAAYSKVYGYEGYAVNDLENFQEEYGEQLKFLHQLLEKNTKQVLVEAALAQEELEEREFQGTYRNDR